MACEKCNDGIIVWCVDDMCRGIGRCIHGDGERLCECESMADEPDDDYPVEDDETEAGGSVERSRAMKNTLAIQGYEEQIAVLAAKVERLEAEDRKAPDPSFYVCTRCGLLYQSLWGCGCANDTKAVSHD